MEIPLARLHGIARVRCVEHRSPRIGGYGHLFEEYIHYNLGAQEVSDLVEVADFVRNLVYVDRWQIGLYGVGYEGTVVIHAMLGFPQVFKAGFADSPIVDWRRYTAFFSERYLGLLPERAPDYDDSDRILENAGKLAGHLCSSRRPTE